MRAIFQQQYNHSGKKRFHSEQIANCKKHTHEKIVRNDPLIRFPDNTKERVIKPELTNLAEYQENLCG